MQINKFIDHTLLKASATDQDIQKLCSEAIQYDFKSVCVNPAYVNLASKLLENTDVLVCTVIGFPLGANTKEIKALEAMDAIRNGADEIDMVINIGKAKAHDYAYIEEEIKMVVAASAGKTTKVIIETCYLTDEEKVACCLAAKNAHATFVKTSTGFGTGGATPEDIHLMREAVGPEMGVKASGGVRTLQDLEVMVENGATRIGASSGVAIMQNVQHE
ncbi:MAG: deoxyribose-phosphate aldolase [Prevotella sp.]|nr:deoxyribose-phosphate aldolase [Staphylococcus sp.]MCM1349944.1 deoxyribose-phosphate aldolase [Prevotella sp.]